MEERSKSSPPYRDLYIYLVNRAIEEAEEAELGDNFLGNWVEDENSFLFFSKPAGEKVRQLISRHKELKLLEEHHFAYEEWQGDRVSTIKVGPLVFALPWEDVEIGQGEKKIILDPGVVFGSGLHPTTKHCLIALTDVCKWGEIERVLDLGTGTGILALAACFMGCKEVVAVDLNPLAVKTAQRNVEMNGVEESVKVVQGNALDFAGEPADLVIANLHYDVLAKLLKERAFRSKRFFILSGLMRSQVSEIKEKLEKYGLSLIGEWEQECTWFTLLAESKT